MPLARSKPSVRGPGSARPLHARLGISAEMHCSLLPWWLAVVVVVVEVVVVVALQQQQREQQRQQKSDQDESEQQPRPALQPCPSCSPLSKLLLHPLCGPSRARQQELCGRGPGSGPIQGQHALVHRSMSGEGETRIQESSSRILGMSEFYADETDRERRREEGRGWACMVGSCGGLDMFRPAQWD